MSQVIYRYPIPLQGGVQMVEMPGGAEILHVGWRKTERGIVHLWARVDPTIGAEERRFRVVGTGQPNELKGGDHYLGTLFVDDGDYVFHVFEPLR